MDKLARQRTHGREPAAAIAAFYGLMPASISHEGYSAKPMHSYWDDFWALRGYKDAVAASPTSLGQKHEMRTRSSHRATSSARDLYCLARGDAAAHAIDYLPGCGGARRLRRDLDDDRAVARPASSKRCRRMRCTPRSSATGKTSRSARDGTRAWDAYTPYEWRTLGTFVRLGWRDRAQRVDRLPHERPAPGGVESVGRSRRPRPREVALRRRHAARLGRVGLHPLDARHVRVRARSRSIDRHRRRNPAAWINAKDGVGITGLRTPYGSLSYTVRRENERVTLHIDKGVAPPGGFVFESPFGSASDTRINGKPAEWKGSLLPIEDAPADITFDVALMPTTH